MNMKTASRIPGIFILIGFLFAMGTVARADAPAVGYWVVDVSDLIEAIDGKVKDLQNLKSDKLDGIAISHGWFDGDCDLWFRTKTVQFRIEARDDGKELEYTMRLWTPQAKSQEFGGKLAVTTSRFSAEDGWRGKKTIVVFRRVNLKR